MKGWIIIIAAVLLLALLIWRIKVANSKLTKNDGELSKIDDFFFWFYFCGILMLGVLAWAPLTVADKIGARNDRKRRAASRWQFPVGDAEFLRGCGIAAGSDEAGMALEIRRKLAGEIAGWTRERTFAPEDIAPDMKCRELLRGSSPHIWLRDGVDSIGFEAVRAATRSRPLPPEALEKMAVLEDRRGMTVDRLFRNYLDVIRQYRGGEENQ